MKSSHQLTVLTLGTLGLIQALVGWGLWFPMALYGLAHDAQQGVKIESALVWQTALVLATLCGPALRLLRPVLTFLDAPQFTVQDARSARDAARDFPRLVTRWILLSNLNVYALGCIVLRVGADLPWQEAAKNLILGLLTGLLSAVLAYFVLSARLRSVVERCNLLDPAPLAPVRMGLLGKTRICLLVVGVVPLIITLVLSYTSSEQLLEAGLAQLGAAQIETLSHQIKTGQHWNPAQELAGADRVGIADRRGRLLFYQGPEDSRAQFQDDLARIASLNGTMVLRDHATRVLVWRALTLDTRLVSCLLLSDYADQLNQGLHGPLLAGLLTLVLAFGLAWVLAGHLVAPVSQLTSLARKVPSGAWPGQMPVTDDEIGVLGETLKAMLDELKGAQDWREQVNRQLGALLADRNRKMEQLRTLFTVSRSVSSNLEPTHVLEELVRHVQGMMNGVPCSLLTQERGRLVLRVCLGLDREAHPDPGQFRLSETPCFLTREQAGFPSELPGDVQGLLSVPLLINDSPVGLVLVFCTGAAPDLAQVDLLRRVALQAGVALENARLYAERDHVTQLLQRALIPARLGFPGLEVGHHYQASKLMSGDYYDLIPLDEHRVAIVMADVAGKGPDAAIQTVRARHLVRASALAGYTPSQVLALLNKAICEDEEGRIVTAFYAEADLLRGTLTWCNAGHEPPLFWKPSLQQFALLEAHDPVLGAVEGLAPEETVSYLERESFLLLYTDGVTEARASSGEFMGLDPVLELAQGHLHSPQQLVDSIYAEVDRFASGSLSDDLSLLAVLFARR